MTAPKLRFKEFNTDYTNTTFEKLKGFSIQSGKSEEKGDTGEFPFYGSTGVIGYKDIFDYEGKSILIARVGANAGSLYQIDGKYSVSDNTLRLTVSDGTSLDYLRELLIKFNLNRLVFGTGQPLVTGGMIKKVNIFIPEFTEQTKIATFLSAVDEKISQLSQKLHLLGQYKQGMMQKLFSQQIRFKADDGSEFGEWNFIELGEALSYEQPTKYIVSSTEYLDTYPTPVLTAGKSFILGYTNEQTGIFDASNDNVIIFDDFTTAYKFVNFSFKVKSSAMKILKTNPAQNNIYYLYSTFSTLNFPIGDEHKRRWISEYSKQEIPLPCLAEQTKIANFLSSIDQKIDVVSEQLEQAKLWKKGLLQQMFV